MKPVLKIIFLFVALIVTACHSTTSNLLFPVVYFDLDGTLLDSNKEIRPKVMAAIEKYRHCGGKVSIATGRSYTQARDYLNLVKPNFPIILADGALVLAPETETVLSTNPLSQDIADKFKNIAKDIQGLEGVFFYYKDKIDCLCNSERAKVFAKNYFMTIRNECRSVQACLAAGKNQNETPLKIIFLLQQDLQNEADKLISQHFGDTIQTYHSQKNSYIELSPAGNNKAVTMATLLKSKNMSMKDVVFFGDADNDTQSLAAVPLGIAMTGCHPDSCKAATFMTGSNDSDSIAMILERLILKKECL